MKKRILYILALLLIIVVLISTISWGFGKKSAIKKINALLDIVLEANDGQDEWCWGFYKITGIHLEINKPPHNVYPEKFRIAFASGDLPDVAEMQTGDYIPTAAAGHLVALDDFIKNSKNAKNVDPKYYEHYRLKDGKVYAWPINSGGGCVMYLRKDWLDKLGMKVPTTWAEYYEVLKAFSQKDPDGNGKADTFGYTVAMKVPPAEVDYYNRFLMQDAWLYFTKKGGKWVDGFSEPEMKNALERFKKVYEEKLCDQEIFTNTTSAARTKIYDGQCGSMEYWTGVWAKTFNDNSKAKNKVADLPPIYAIKEAKYFNRVSPCFGITKKCKNPQAVFDNFIDLLCDKGPGQILFTYGLENVHYKKAGDKFQMQPSLSNPKNIFQKAYIDSLLSINDMPLMTKREPYEVLSNEIQKKTSMQLDLVEGKENFQKYGADLNNLKLEIFAKVLTGKMSVDEGLAQYKEKAKALKLEEMLKEINS